MPALEGTILVTGASGGLGTALASHISSVYPNHHGIFTVRNSCSPSPSLQAALQQHSSHDILSLNLGSHENIRAAAASINERVSSGLIPPIGVLVLNAGFLEFSEQTYSKDGFDMTFAANYLGHFLLTLLLLQSMDKEHGRVVWVGSHVHDPSRPGISAHIYPTEKWKTFLHDGTFDSIAKGTWSSAADDHTFRSGFRRYGAAKMCVAMMVGELQERLAADSALKGITSVGVDPGTMGTGMLRRSHWLIRNFPRWIIIAAVTKTRQYFWPGTTGPMRTVHVSAKDIMDAGMNVQGKFDGGAYLDGLQPTEISDEAKDIGKRQVLWRDSLGYVQLEEGETVLSQWR
ncbi:putative short-chain dehydrogenase [Colletotrichum somersetense]|nr:putative short-chain dehydrogenase [Colletotrichum somersetense]